MLVLTLGVGGDCLISRWEISAIVDSGVWNVTEAVIEEHGLQAIVNCSRAGDTISLQTTQMIQPSTRVVISHRLTIGRIDLEEGNGRADDLKASITCPSNDGVFLIEWVD